MERKYKKIFDDVHLSEETRKSIQKETEKIRTGKQKTIGWKRGGFVKIAAAMLGIVMTSGVVTYAAQSYIKYQEEKVERFETKKEENYTKVQVNQYTKEPVDSTSAGAVHGEQSVYVAKDVQGNDIDTNCLYDVTLGEIPKGYKQDKEYPYLYTKKNQNGVEEYFSVILYHLTEDYHTNVLSFDGVQNFQTKDKEGIYSQKDSRSYVIFVYAGTNYMVYLDGRNMDVNVLKKVAENITLKKVSTEEEIQASYIEWTPEHAKQVEEWQAIIDTEK